MNRTDLTLRVRSMTRDFSGSVFRDTDVFMYLNEGIDRFKQVIEELKAQTYLNQPNDEPSMIPEQYQSLLALYSTSRCFGQDDRHYQAGTYMNEFETKLQELSAKIESGEVEIIDPVTGEPITSEAKDEYVRDNYFFRRGRV